MLKNLPPLVVAGDPAQFSHGLQITVRIHQVTVTAKSDMFDNVHTLQRMDAVIRKKQFNQVCGGGHKIIQP